MKVTAEEIRALPPPARKGDWKQTFTGKMFWPLDPRPEDVDVIDIAHSLSLICRFGGHCKWFYSVAEHSVRVSQLVAPEFAFAALLHDAAEAYVGDMVSPLKAFMPDYRMIEDNIALVIGARLGVVLHPLPAEIKKADLEMLAVEARDLMGPAPAAWKLPYPPPAGVSISARMSPAAAEAIFLSRLQAILGGSCP